MSRIRRNVGATLDRTNTITDDSFEDSEGAVTVQQNNGDANVMGAALGILASDGSDDIDAVVDQTVTATGTVDDAGDRRSDGINDVSSNRDNTIDDDSFDDYRGIFNVQQNNGSVNVLGSAIGVVASINPDEANANGVVNSTVVDGTVTDSVVTVGVASAAPGPVGGSPGFSDRVNVIDDAFNGVEGVGTVIQNNGDVNVIGSAIAVAAHDGGATGFGNAVSSAALGGLVSNNSVTVVSAGANGTQFDNTITNSFQGLNGVTTVIQNNGSANVIGSAVTVTANF